MKSKRLIVAILVNGALLIAGLLTAFPLLWMVSVSLMPANASLEFPPPLLPETISFEHYRKLFDEISLARNLLNSTMLAVAITTISLVFNSIAGYSFAKLKFAGRDRIFQCLMAALVIPGQVAMLPLFLLLKQFHFVNSYWGVIVPGMTSIFGIFLVRQYVLSIPDSLLDAARIDGAGELRIWWSIALPLCRPILITLAIFTFLGCWSDFMWPLIILSDSNRYTLPIALANLLGDHAQDTELMMAGAVLTLMPALLLFLALQRHYIRGLTLGGVKD